MPHENHAYCPVCHRYCGPTPTCPYCDAKRELPWLLTRIRYGAWIVAIIGVGMLIVAARLSRPQTLPIAEISPTMQFAQIYFEGQITETPRVSRNQNSAATDLDDDSGQTLRIVFLDEALAAMRAHSPPITKGMGLHVSGNLRVRADEPPVLFIRSPEQFRLLE